MHAYTVDRSTCPADCPNFALPPIAGADLSYSNDFTFPSTATYTCANGNSMSQTLQDDGTWSAAGALSCTPPAPPGNWIMQTTIGDTCDTTCAAAGFTCQDGDWGVSHSAAPDPGAAQAAMAAALEAAGMGAATQCGTLPNTWAA